MRRSRAASGRRAVKQARQNITSEEDSGVELDEICTRLNRIIERSNRIDLQLSEIERSRKTPKLQSPVRRTTPGRYTPPKSINQSSAFPEAPLSLIDQDPRRATPTQSSPPPSASKQTTTITETPPPRITRPIPEPPQEVTLAMVYEELVALRREVAAIAATQQEMKRELLARR